MELKKVKFLKHLTTVSSRDGKNLKGEKVVLNSLRKIKRRKNLKIDPFLKKVAKNIEPMIRMKIKRIGGVKYKIPIYMPYLKEKSISINWLVKDSCGRKMRGRESCLTKALYEAWEGRGVAVRNKLALHKKGLENRAFIRYL